MPIIALDRPATAGTNIIAWSCPFPQKERVYLVMLSSQNRGTISFLNCWLDMAADPLTESGSIKAQALSKLWMQRIGEELVWTGRIRVYDPMKVCFGYFNCASGDELNARVMVEHE